MLHLTAVNVLRDLHKTESLSLHDICDSLPTSSFRNPKIVLNYKSFINKLIKQIKQKLKFTFTKTDASILHTH
jgi:hypothetical protein